MSRSIAIILSLVPLAICDLSILHVDPGKCPSNCGANEECRRYKLRVGNEFHPCSPRDAHKCVPTARTCDAKEKAKYCSLEHQECTFETYHYCILYNRGIHQQSDYSCSFGHDPCAKIAFFPSNKLCYVKEIREMVGGVGVLKESMIVRDKPIACESAAKCPTGMACWSDLNSLNDGTSDYYTETCSFQTDPCASIHCGKGEECGITSRFVRASPELCQNYGPLCVEVSQRNEVAECRRIMKTE